jgi:hypothetical protein
MGFKKENVVLWRNERKNPTPKSMEEIKSKYGSETLKTKEKKK